VAKAVGLVGSIVNKAGNFVFTTWKGIQVIKVYQPNVSNPRSAAQTAQRTKFDYSIQYGSAMNQIPYLKHLWKLITAEHRTEYNEFVSRNLLSATFEADNTLCTNLLIISDNDDYIQNFELPGDQSCLAGVWTLDGLDLCGCGDEPDGILLVQVFNANLLTVPGDSPFPNAHMCEKYSQVLTWPIASLDTNAYYEGVYEICCPACADPAAECCDASVWLIPVWSNGVDASYDPSLITKAGNPILVCTPAP